MVGVSLAAGATLRQGSGAGMGGSVGWGALRQGSGAGMGGSAAGSSTVGALGTSRRTVGDTPGWGGAAAGASIGGRITVGAIGAGAASRSAMRVPHSGQKRLYSWSSVLQLGQTMLGIGVWCF